MKTHHQFWSRLEAELQENFGFGLPVYELLLTLEEQGPLRMTDLAERLHYSSGRLTRLADKLEQKHLIQRTCCKADGRGFDVSLTGSGQQQLRAFDIRMACFPPFVVRTE